MTASTPETVEGWEAEWELITESAPRAGAQGSVALVRRREDGQLGALKRLHQAHLKDSERRQRMAREVAVLEQLKGHGTPPILAHNMARAEDKAIRLWFITEWIEGRTLQDLYGGSATTIQHAQAMALHLVDTLEACHHAGVVHRDIKPDNVVIARATGEPLLVDFGIAFTADPEAGAGLETDTGQELGNRFLRLPDFAPGRESRDPRSDLTLLCGILFFLVSGVHPRVLVDEKGLPPHEALIERVPSTTKTDARWSGLIRVFNVGFQPALEARFQSASQLRQYLNEIGAERPEESGELGRAIADYRRRLESRQVKNAAERDAAVRRASEVLMDRLAGLTNEAHLRVHRRGVNREAPGQLVEIVFGIGDASRPMPFVDILHKVDVTGSEIRASYQVGLVGGLCTYYAGPSSDAGRLQEHMLREAPTMLAKAVRALQQVLAG